MTILERFLCAFGFHGKFEDTNTTIVDEYNYNIPTIGTVQRCTTCGRRISKFV